MPKKGSSTPSKVDKKAVDKKAVLPDPVITNGDCSRCHFNGDIVSECIKCSICYKQFHALCRDSKACFTDNSICSKTFFDMYGPLAAHYGRNKSRWGQFIFICSLCNTQYPGLFPKASGTDELIDVLSLNSPVKCNTLTPNFKETQTVISGSLSDNKTPGLDMVAEKIEKLTKLNEEVLDNIKKLHQLSNDQSSSFNSSMDKLTTQTKSLNSVNSCPKSSNISPNLDPVDYSKFNFDPQKCQPIKDFKENFLQDDDLTKVIDFFENSNDFKTVKSSNGSGRDVAYYGEFNYRYGVIQHNSRKIPEVIDPIIKLISEKYPNTMTNSCLVTRYQDGSNTCPKHNDDEPFIAPCSDIFTFSVGSERSMMFTSVNNDTESVTLPSNSLLVFSRSSQEFWKHEITSSETSDVRYSFTFRQLAPYYANSTLIVGDSNTQNLKFGAGRNTFGVWMPGCREKAGKVDDLPEPDDLEYPYRNLVIHSGINDLRANTHQPIPVLISKLKTKCLRLASKFVKMKIHISMLLPTKDPGLNVLVNEFNSQIKAFAEKHTNISVITHANLCNSSGLLTHDLGRHNHDGSALIFDTVHLGSRGISVFCANIKGSIITKKKPENTSKIHIASNSVKSGPQYMFWNPHHNYRPSNRPLPTHVNPWDGNHIDNFLNRNPQPILLDSFNNGYQP